MRVVGESSLEESLRQHLPVVKLQLLMKTEEFDHSISCGPNPTTCIHREDHSSARSSLKDEIRSFNLDRTSLNFVEERQESKRQKLASSRGRCLPEWEEKLGLTATAISAQVWRPEGEVVKKTYRILIASNSLNVGFKPLKSRDVFQSSRGQFLYLSSVQFRFASFAH